MKLGSRVAAHVAAASAAVASVGVPAVRAEDPVLHEYVPNAGEDELSALVARENGGTAAIVYDGQVLPKPRGGPLRGDEMPLTGAARTRGDGRAAPDGTPSFRPDRVTDLEAELRYYGTFTPSVAPFKRVTALDEVALGADGKTPVLRLGSQQTRTVPIRGRDDVDTATRARFWGSVVLDFSEDERIPLPSVAPEARILSLETEPDVSLHIEKDGADNFFAVAGEPVPNERVRVTFLTDAPKTYFNTSIPDVPSDALADQLPGMPARVREHALRFARELGLSRGDPLPSVLRTLARHFRSFEESSEPPENTGNIYLDLARAQKGVCRHRVYAFVITAQALGVPARFVYNEAHSWAEVLLAQVGWMRIDLGGAAEGLQAHGMEDRTMYRPSHPDPLPQPKAYRESYSRARSRERTSSGSGGRSASMPPPGSRAGARTRAGGGRPHAADRNAPADPRHARKRGGGAPDRTDESAPKPVWLKLSGRHYEVVRGRRLEVTGRAIDPDGNGVPGLRIEVLLRGRREELLGVTVTREQGWFHGRFGVPPDLATGDYRLVVRTPGDETHRAAVAR